MIPTSDSSADVPVLRLQTYSDLTGDDKLNYEADIDAMNWILLGIPNDIYNSDKIVINTKFLNSLQPEWSKYVKRAHQQHKLVKVDYDVLFDFLTENEPDVKAFRAKRAARNHDPLALVANSYVNSSFSRSTHQYYVIHPPSILDHDNDYHGDILAVEPEDTLSTAMMLLASAKDEPVVHLDDEENDFMLTSAIRDDQLEELNAPVIIMAHI
ncbi:hypothetical protein Tco_0529855 [Tanacetum coccineum]